MQSLADALNGEAEREEYLSAEPALVAEQPKQHVFRADVAALGSIAVDLRAGARLRLREKDR